MATRRRCMLVCIATAACACSGTIIYLRWSGTERMTVSEALTRLDMLGPTLTDQQAAVLAAALGRQTLAAIDALRRIASMGGDAGIEAANRLRQAEEALR